MTIEAIGSVEVFFSYDQVDEPLKKRLEKQLHFLKRQGLISIWHSYAAHVGQVVDTEIKKHLETADLILLLVSPDFIASDRCCNVDVIEAMRRHEAGDAHVIPIILRDVYWKDEPFKKLQPLPTNGKPVKSWSKIDEAFLDIADNIQQVVKGLLVNRSLDLIKELCQEKRYEEALTACGNALDLAINNTNKALTRLLKGNILFNLEKYEEALKTYEEAEQCDPGIADMNFCRNKGLALQHLERFDEAYTAYKKAERLGPCDGNFYRNKGIVLDYLAQQAYRMAEQAEKDS